MYRYPEEFRTNQMPNVGKICYGLNWGGIYSLCDGTKFQNFVDFRSGVVGLPLFAIQNFVTR
jgi:hypothetical protein